MTVGEPGSQITMEITGPKIQKPGEHFNAESQGVIIIIMTSKAGMAAKGVLMCRVIEMVNRTWSH